MLLKVRYCVWKIREDGFPETEGVRQVDFGNWHSAIMHDVEYMCKTYDYHIMATNLKFDEDEFNRGVFVASIYNFERSKEIRYYVYDRR